LKRRQFLIGAKQRKQSESVTFMSLRPPIRRQVKFGALSS
jgi:hypothetical protein